MVGHRRADSARRWRLTSEEEAIAADEMQAHEDYLQMLEVEHEQLGENDREPFPLD
jgi:hypothetical protein